MHGSSLVRRALELARARQRQAAGLPPARPGHDGISRRALIKTLGAGAAALSLGDTAIAQLGKPRQVAIVGGGLAGLSALRQLTAAGIPARLYEARNRTGGRVFTLRDNPAPGMWCEVGGQLVNSDHADMIELADSYGVRLIDALELEGAEQVMDGGKMITAATLATALGPIAAQIAQDSERLDKDPAILAELDALSVAAYLDRHAALIGSPTARRLLEQSIRTEYGSEPGEASALSLIFNLPTVHGEAYEVLGHSDERYIVEGGSQRIPEALALAHADKIEMGKQLVALAPAPGGAVQLRFADGSSTQADRVILTLPASLLGSIDPGGLFSPQWTAFAAEVRLGRNAKLNAAYGTRPWLASGMGAAGATWDVSTAAIFGEAWDATLGQKGDAGLLTWFLGGRHVDAMPDRPALRGAVEKAVAGAMGELGVAARPDSLVTGWHADPMTRGSYLCFRPGQFAKFGGQLWVEEECVATQRARSGPIIFAGEHVSDAWPGYMNGAAQTGRLAAQTIIDGA